MTRFKTKEELIAEYGPEKWRSKAGLNSDGHMDYLLGTPHDGSEQIPRCLAYTS